MKKKSVLKKIAVGLLVFSLLAIPMPERNAKAVVTEESMNGDPMSNENHFIWDLMADMQTPDDPDCPSLASTALAGTAGMDATQISQVATMACNNLAQMRTSMESGMGEGSDSVETNLFDETNWHSVENLYFQHMTNGVADGKIAFSVPIDFMSYAFMSFMTSFGENMDSSEGRIGLDADVVGGFANYGATLTMYNIPEYESPVILVDGEVDTDGVVSNLAYDRDNSTITFSAAHFTEFEVAEESEVGDTMPDIDTVKAKKYYNPISKKWLVKMIVKGDEYDRDTDVTLGKTDARKVNYKSKNRVVATFALSKLAKSGKDGFIIRVKNGSESKRFKKKLKLSSLTSEYQELK